MGWISRDGYLSQAEMENNADIIIAYYRSIGMNESSIAGLLANMEAESTLSPTLNEVGGTGYGLVQWTPKSVLIDHANYLGLTPYTSGDNQIRIIIQEMIGNFDVREWFTTSGLISNYYNSGATPDMIGLTGNDFINNTMNWSPSKLAILFMSAYERPSRDPSINHYTRRQQYANEWYQYMGHTPPVPPVPPTPSIESKRYNFIIFNRNRRQKRYE